MMALAFIAKAGAFIRGSRPAQLALLVLVVAIAAFALAKCTGGNDEAAEQAQQTTRSSEAISNAAQEAIAKIGNQTATEHAINAAIIQTQEGISNAQTVSDIRLHVIAGLCAKPSHRDDAACKVR